MITGRVNKYVTTALTRVVRVFRGKGFLSLRNLSGGDVVLMLDRGSGEQKKGWNPISFDGKYFDLVQTNVAQGSSTVSAIQLSRADGSNVQGVVPKSVYVTVSGYSVSADDGSGNIAAPAGQTQNIITGSVDYFQGKVSLSFSPVTGATLPVTVAGCECEPARAGNAPVTYSYPVTGGREPVLYAIAGTTPASVAVEFGGEL